MSGQINNLSTSVKMVRHAIAAAAGAGTITPTAGVDTKGFKGCMFVVALGTVTDGTPTIKVQQSDDDGVADTYDDLVGSSVAIALTDDNKLAFVDIVNPQKRYLKCLFVRAGTTTGSVLDGIVALLYKADFRPTAQDSTVAAGGEMHFTPAEGTA